nr:unnamed protein product [Digitaria exilis]
MKGLWLSPLDLVQAKRGHTPTIGFYRSNDAVAADFFDVARLKHALAKALVAFYPLAGRLGVDNNDGRVEISCNAEGALFVAARCDDFTVDDFVDFKPSPELRKLFVPRIEPSSIMMAIQVTFLKCGGVALGVSFHHAAIDGISAFHFLRTWASICRDGEDRAAMEIELPCHDRTLLRPRSPPAVHPNTLSVFCPNLTVHEPSGPNASEVFTITKDQLASLKRLCGGVSTFCAVSALVWRCACVARRIPPDAEARVVISANIRRSLRPPLPSTYFGNAIISLTATATTRDVASETMVSVAARVKGAVVRMDDEVVRSAIDYFELADETEDDLPPMIPRGRGVLPVTELRIVSWLGMPWHGADFGWGKPRVMGLAESNHGGFVHLVDDVPAENGGSGGVRVFACMEAANIMEFERLLYANLECLAG